MSQYSVPPSVWGRQELASLIREIESVDYYYTAQSIRANDPKAVPAISRLLEDVVRLNKLDLGAKQGRQALLMSLKIVKDKSPSIHVTFASHAEGQTVDQIIAWIRQNLHPTALVSIGLQPNIIGGCIVRTPDHIYDFSFRRKFHNERRILSERVAAAIGQTV